MLMTAANPRPEILEVVLVARHAVERIVGIAEVLGGRVHQEHAWVLTDRAAAQPRPGLSGELGKLHLSASYIEWHTILILATCLRDNPRAFGASPFLRGNFSAGSGHSFTGCLPYALVAWHLCADSRATPTLITLALAAVAFFQTDSSEPARLYSSGFFAQQTY